MTIELRAMSEYSMKDQPAPILDIGLWMDIIENVVNLGIVICMYLIIFTSNKLEEFFSHFGINDSSMQIIITFGILHVIFGVKFLM